MNSLYELREGDVRPQVEERLKEFESFRDKPNEEWFSELCFCILTANSKAVTALNIQQELGCRGFASLDKDGLVDCIRRNKHRFHNNKASYICSAREHLKVKDKIISIIDKDGEKEGREWLVANIKGLGYKEASHFLRNVGYKNLAILDRHIINLMLEWNLLDERPKSLTKKIYLSIEQKFGDVASEHGMSIAELDLYMWYMKVGKVLK